MLKKLLNLSSTIILLAFLSGCAPVQLHFPNPDNFPKLDSAKSFAVRNVYDLRGTKPDAIAPKEQNLPLMKTGIKNFIKTTLDTALQLTGLKADSHENTDYFIDLIIKTYSLEIKTSGLKESGNANSFMYVTFIDAKTDTPVITARILEHVSSKTLNVNRQKLLDSLTFLTAKKFIDKVTEISKSSPEQIKNLSSGEEYIPLDTDTLLLSSVYDLKTTNGSKFFQDSILILSWKTSTAPRGIAKTFYKLGAPPLDNCDTTGSLKNIPPDTIPLTKEGQSLLSLWVADSAGNINYKNTVSTQVTYHKAFSSKDLTKTCFTFGVQLPPFPVPCARAEDRSILSPETGEHISRYLTLGWGGFNAGFQVRISPSLVTGLSGDIKTLFPLGFPEESEWAADDSEEYVSSGMGFLDLGADLYTGIFTTDYSWGIKPTVGWRKFIESAGFSFLNDTSGERDVEKYLSKEGFAFGTELTRYIHIKAAVPFSASLGCSYYPFFDDLYKITAGFTWNTRGGSDKTQPARRVSASIGPFVELYQNKDISLIIFSVKCNTCF